ncbi:hypothetical protein [Chryseobacterium sp.]|nr:hypothetical protein [Chryseobacterium sp.]
MRQEYQYLKSLELMVFRITDFDVKNTLSVVMRELEDYTVPNYGPVF